MFTLNLKGACPMSPIVYRMNGVLSHVVQRVPVGTNLGLFHCLWMLLSGRLLLSRGAVIPGLAALGLAAEASRRAWAALAYGQWHAAQLLEAWAHLVRKEQVFHAHQYGGYRPVACDLVGFFRPRLRDCPTKHYSSAAGKALPAIPLGIAARVGTAGTQRLAVPCLLVRGEPTETSATALQLRLLQRANTQLAADEALVCDRGFPLRQLQAAGVQRYVIRAPVNFTARRATLPAYQGKGRKPGRGALVRPLPRTYKGRTIAATPPDRHETWQLWVGPSAVSLHAAFWDDLVCVDTPPGAPTFSTVLIQDPRFDEPLLLNNLTAVDGSPPAGLLSRPLARGRVALDRDTDVGGSASIRLCARKSSAAPCTGPGGRRHLNVCRGDPAGAAHGLLGSGTETDVRQAPAAPSRGALCRLAGAA
jgi:hypothetical protein